MKVLDLFSGIGGFSLGLERAGMETVAFCEIDENCKMVLKKHWPDVPIFEDVSMLEPRLSSDHRFLKEVNLICGGYPCTGHSVAGAKKGFKNDGSSLWKEFHRLAFEIKPEYCIIENSPNLRNTGLAELLEAFDEIGYNAEWSIISAYSVGSPHQRERIYIVFWREDLSYPNPFRFWQANLKKEKASWWWWAKRRIKRNPMFKKFSKIGCKIIDLDDGIPIEMARLNDEKLKQLGNVAMPQILELIGMALMNQES